MNNANSMDIYPWDILDHEAREIVEKVLLKWNELFSLNYQDSDSFVFLQYLCLLCPC